MTNEDIVRLNYEHYAGLFPRSCGVCGRVFATLREYILQTTPVGPTMSYDAELADWDTTTPIGGSALANCLCGNTMGLTSELMPLPEIRIMLEWIRTETARRGVGQEELLQDLRHRVRTMALKEQA